MNVVALIIGASAAGGGLPRRPAGLIEYAGGFQGAGYVPACASAAARARTATGGSGSSVRRQGAMR